MLDAAEIAAMQDTCEGAFPDAITIVRRTMTADGIGGRSAGATPLLSMPGRVSLPSGRDRERAGALQNVIERRVDFPFDADLRDTDEITWNGKTYQVLMVSRDRSWSLTGVAYIGAAT